MLKEIIHQVPFFRLFLPFIAGIITALLLPVPEALYFAVFIGLFLSIIIFLRFFLKNRVRNQWLFGFMFHIVLYFFGLYLVNMKRDKIVQKFPLSDEQKYMAIIRTAPAEKENTYQVIMELQSAKNNTWEPAKTLITAYIEKTPLASRLKIGDLLVFKGFLNGVDGPKNPGQFNYRQYLFYKGITKQAYIKSGYYRVLERRTKFRLFYWSDLVRNKLLDKYREHHLEEDEFAVLSALSLGFKDNLNPEIRSSYSASGAMHLLAVSGLHVGVIFLVISKLFFFLNKKKYQKVIKAFLIIMLLCAYAFITGLSPSISRATLMLSLVVIGKSFERSINVYNSVLASAFILLIINPFLITSVGFQLSYLAVVGIVYFHQKIYGKIRFKNFLVDKIWLMFTVSFAAQLATFPLTIYYFNQFPNYFFITNIIVLPLVSVIIYAAMVFFVFSFISPVAGILGWVLKFLVGSLNKLVGFIEHLPMSLTSNIYINLGELFLLFFIIVFLCFFFETKRKRFFGIALLGLTSFLSLNIMRCYEIKNTRGFYVFSVNKVSVYGFIDGRTGVLLAGKDFLTDEKAKDFNIKGGFLKHGIKNYVEMSMQNIDPGKTAVLKTKQIFCKQAGGVVFFQYNGKKIGIAGALPKSSKYLNKPVELDVLVLNKEFKENYSRINEIFRFDRLVLDSSFGYWELEKARQLFDKQEVNYESVIDRGAIFLN